MPGRGFPPAPTVEKLAKGERRPSRINYDEPKLDPPPEDKLRPPSGLQGAGLREWRAQVRRLAERGVLTEADLTAFEDYCRALSELRALEQKARTADRAHDAKAWYRCQNLVLKVRSQVAMLRSQCGLTPSSRSAVRVAKPMAMPVETPAERYLRALPGGKPSA